MRLVRILLICLALVLVMSGISIAQDRYLDCGQVAHSSTDWVIMDNIAARPGDTVWIPFSITNVDNPLTDSADVLMSFLLMLKYDSNFVKPLIDSTPIVNLVGDTLIDTLQVQFQTVGRLQAAIDSVESTSFFVKRSENPADEGALQAWFNLTFADSIGVIPAGSGPVFKIAFIVDSLMPDGATTNFSFPKIQECVIFEGNPFCADCRLTQFAIMNVDSTYFDSLNQEQTAISIRSIFPSVTAGTLTADVTPPPRIDNFALDADIIMEGGVTTLRWDVINADSLFITGPSGLSVIETNLNWSMAITAPSSAGTHRYFLKALNEFDSAFASASIVVVADTGGVPGNNSPTISVGSSFITEVAQPVSFLVTASDLDAADVITLSAKQPLPNNASFASAVGSGSVSSTFSWTPDVGQEGTYTIVFEATDTKVTTQVSVSITVTALQVDRLFSTSAPGEAPVGGLAGKDVVLLPINLVTAQTVYGIQFDFGYDPVLFDVDSFMVTGRTLDYVVYDNIGQTPGLIKVLTFGLANEPVVPDTTTAVLYVSMSIDSNAVPGDYPVYITNGWESINPDPAFPSLELATDSGIIQVDLPGDVNLDKKIDVADLVNIVAYIIGTFPFPERQFEVADVITNDTVNVFDLVGVINLIFGIPLSPVSGQPIFDEWATVELDYTSLSAGQSDELIVRSELPTDIAGVEIIIEYDPAVVVLGEPSLTADNSSFAMRYEDNRTGRLIAIMNFTNPFRKDHLITSGEADLLNIPLIALTKLEAGNEQQLRITRAWLSTSEAVAVPVEGLYVPLPKTFVLKQNYPNPFNPITTIEFTLGVNEDGSATKHVNLDIFNILGRHVKSLVDKDMIPGYYRIDWDATNEVGQKTATGIYLYRLRVGDEMKTKKMLLLK